MRAVAKRDRRGPRQCRADGDRAENRRSEATTDAGGGAAWRVAAVRARVEDRQCRHRPRRLRALPAQRLHRRSGDGRRAHQEIEGRPDRDVHHLPDARRGHRLPDESQGIRRRLRQAAMRRLGEHPLGTFVVVSLLFAGASVLAWLSALVLDWPSALGRYLPLYFWERRSEEHTSEL